MEDAGGPAPGALRGRLGSWRRATRRRLPRCGPTVGAVRGRRGRCWSTRGRTSRGGRASPRRAARHPGLPVTRSGDYGTRTSTTTGGGVVRPRREVRGRRRWTVHLRAPARSRGGTRSTRNARGRGGGVGKPWPCPGTAKFLRGRAHAVAGRAGVVLGTGAGSTSPPIWRLVAGHRRGRRGRPDRSASLRGHLSKGVR